MRKFCASPNMKYETLVLVPFVERKKCYKTVF